MNLISDTKLLPNILIVDDDMEVMQCIQSLLECNEYNCILATSGEEAIRIVEKKEIDIVLLDVMLPDMNGFTIAEKIKDITGDFLPVIMISALDSDDHKIEGLTHADDYITKPFSSRVLIARIKSLLRNSRLHKDLSVSKQRFELLYENFPHLYISLDSQMNISDCNSFYRQKFNVTKKEIIGKSIYELFTDDQFIVLEHFFRTLQRFRTVKQRVFQLKKQGSDEVVFVNLTAVFIGDDDTGLYVVIAMEDLTRQMKIQEEQKIARRQLYKSARLASIGTLASGVAHEMNNPLTAILGFSSAIMDRFENNEEMEASELKQYLHIINTEALRCRDIVENLSRFAREAGECLAGPVNLNECIENSIKLMHNKFVKSAVKLEKNISNEVIVAGDTAKIEQLIINILTNCVDFCETDCKIRISQTYSRDEIRFYAIKIEDNGPGIHADIINKVFDPFFTTKEVGRGTGMGLAICHRIMEDLNGNIDIRSDGEHGTAVVLEFVKFSDY